jgi:hypothetical protein
MTQIEKKMAEIKAIREMDKKQGLTRYFYSFTYNEVSPSKGIKDRCLTAYFDKAFKVKPDISEIAEIIEAEFYGSKKILSVKER